MADAQLINLDKSVTTSNFTLNVVQKPSIDGSQKWLYDRRHAVYEAQILDRPGCLRSFQCIYDPPTSAGSIYLQAFDSPVSASNGMYCDAQFTISYPANSPDIQINHDYGESGVRIHTGLYLALSTTINTLTKATANSCFIAVQYL